MMKISLKTVNHESAESKLSNFTVEARVKGVSEEYAEALAVRLAALGLTAWIKQLDITPEQGEP